MKRILPAFAFGLIGVVLLVPAAAEACAVCGAGPGVAGDPTARGFYWGILFLMAMPFAVAGSIGAWMVYRYWRASAGGWRKALACVKKSSPGSERERTPLIFHWPKMP